ncbi:MAG TPA: hypothetical protein VKB78_11915, partial [Pirellulales bacterium]|nr:hypothetical protein [Pirellulales bacterium]
LNLFRMIRQARLHLVPGWRQSKLSVVHVRDLAAVLISAAERGTRLPAAIGEQDGASGADPRGFYFVASEHDPTYAELGRLIGEAMGKRRVLVIAFPRPAVWPIAACGEIMARIRRRAPFAGIDKAREALAGHWICSAARAETELGFAPAAPLSEWLRETAEWYRHEKWL